MSFLNRHGSSAWAVALFLILQAVTIDAYKLDFASRSVATHQACAEGIHIIGVAGNSSDPPRPYSLLTTTVDGLLERIPGSNNATGRYPHVQPSTEISPLAIGAQHLLYQISSYTARCPDTPIVIAGYSFGGIITMNTVCGRDTVDPPTPPLDPKYLPNIIAIILYGEETRAAGQTWNRGTCPGYSGEAMRNNSAACVPYASVIRSWCDYGDNFCCVGTPDENKHGDYPTTYDETVFSLVERKYAKYRKRQQQ